MSRVGPVDILLWLAIVLTALWFVSLVDDTRWGKAEECSRLLIKTANATLTPVHEDAEIQIGACILYFDQPMGGSEQ